jgi:molybdopterin-containing oxidoreductase family iron-sulfur binding subunit
MERSRRTFLKISGMAAIGLGANPVVNVFAEEKLSKPEMQNAPEVLSARQWGLAIDTRKIKTSEDLQKMIEACHKIHNVPELKNERHEIKWIWEEDFQHAFPDMQNNYLSDKIKQEHFPVLCNHCANPPCVRVCPTKATFKRNDGIVIMDFHRCIGCRFCMAACPYGSRSFNFRDPRPFTAEINKKFPTRMKGVVEKCNFCAELLEVGKAPACVEASNGALVFGDLEDANSEIRKVLSQNFTIRRKQGLGTEPSVYYIV